MNSVAVIAHSGKTFGGGLPALRECLGSYGITELSWHEVHKSKQVSSVARDLRAAGTDIVFVWGGDGTVQRCVDAFVGSDTTLAIVPAGTANLLASNLAIPKDIDRAVGIGLHGDRRPIDVGRINGEHFAVMAGLGFDARMIAGASKPLKDRVGRAAYILSGARNIAAQRVRTVIETDGNVWFEGYSSCVLIGNVGALFAGVTVFEHAAPDDGVLEVGVVTAEGAWQWIRAIATTSTKNADNSPFIRTTQAQKIKVSVDTPTRFEVDGGSRKRVKQLKIRAIPAAITIAVPSDRAQ